MISDNKLGLTDKTALADAEERYAKIRARELYDRGILNGQEIGTFAGLRAIHKFMYGDVYNMAGEVRTVDVVKGNTRFSPANILDTSLGFVDIMPQATYDDVVDKYIEMNVAHPFMFGNGCAIRIWLNQMMKAATGKVVDYSKIDHDEFEKAMERCAVDDEMLYNLLSSALTEDVGRTVYLRGIDASFAFEGYSKYRAESVK